MNANLRLSCVPLLLSAALAGCAAGPDFNAPQVMTGPVYTPGRDPEQTAAAGGPGGSAQRFVKVEAVGGAWWRAFGSPGLDALVEEALDASPTLAQARMRLAQARQDYLAQAGGTEWPQADLLLDASRQKINPAALAGGSLIGNRELPPFTLYQAGVMVSYSFDLFGANRRALESLGAQVDYQQYELDAARLTLAGSVVAAAVRHASLAAQIALSEAMLALLERQLEIAGQRYQAGGISEYDLLARRGVVEQARAGMAPLRVQQAQAAHQLAVHLGRTPAQGGSFPMLDALALPAELPVSVPSALARQRPDIRAAEALLHQASANVGVATANLYPQLTLTASAGKEGTRVSDLLSIWSLGAGLTQPLFHGGELRARQRAAEDAYQAALAGYRQTVLQGLQQVADVLRALELDAQELAARDSVRRDAATAAQVARARFEAGGLSQLELLDAQRQALQAALDRSRVQAQRLLDSAALYQALGAKP
jgi:NodT family efflux transporter outer membrane factor (OMF) lipoprotein